MGNFSSVAIESGDASDGSAPIVDEDAVTQRLPWQKIKRVPTVVVVDDSEDAQEWFKHALEAAGYRVLQARNGKEALDVLVDHATPAAVIVDLLMPVMDGFELMDVLRSYTRLSRVPIIVVSALDGQIALHTPSAHFLRKPVGEDELLKSLERALAAPL